MTSTNRLWVLGADDPEMSAIEALLSECGEHVAYAMSGSQRVPPGNAYRADAIHVVDGALVTVYFVECRATMLDDARGAEPYTARQIIVDHHRPGDPGYGVGASEFLRGSSLGQVISALAQLGVLPSRDFVHRIPEALVFAAAADHCLGAAYAGKCPIDVAAFGEWRIATRAAHQGRSVDEIRADIERATARIQSAPIVQLIPGGDGVVDLRGEEIPELPETACRLGVAYLATPRPGPDSRRKIVLQCASPDHLAAWPDWAAANGIVDCYGGDPARGFAGGYID